MDKIALEIGAFMHSVGVRNRPWICALCLNLSSKLATYRLDELEHVPNQLSASHALEAEMNSCWLHPFRRLSFRRDPRMLATAGAVACCLSQPNICMLHSSVADVRTSSTIFCT